MSNFWLTNALTADNMAKLGPLVDGVVGYYGKYTDLYEAMISPSGPMWKRVFITYGAIMSRDVIITGGAYDGASIIGIGGMVTSITGGYQLSIQATDVHLENLRFNGAVGKPNITIGANRAKLMNVWSNSATTTSGHGIEITGGGYHRLMNCDCYGNGGDGIKIAAGGNITTIVTSRMLSNTGWGVRDLTASGSSIILVGNTILGNTAGQISSTTTLLSANMIA